MSTMPASYGHNVVAKAFRSSFLEGGESVLEASFWAQYVKRSPHAESKSWKRESKVLSPGT